MCIYLSSEKKHFATDDFYGGRIFVMEFADWLNTQMADRGMSQSDLARAAKVSNTAISNVLSGMRSPGPDFCTSIAKALRLSPVHVFRIAGLLPPDDSEMDEETMRMLHIFEQLTPDDQEALLGIAQFFIDRREKRSPRPAEG